MEKKCVGLQWTRISKRTVDRSRTIWLLNLIECKSYAAHDKAVVGHNLKEIGDRSML